MRRQGRERAAKPASSPFPGERGDGFRRISSRRFLSWFVVLLAGCSPRPEPVPSSAVEPGRPVTVTVFAIRAVPGTSAIDPRLAPVRGQLRTIAPDDSLTLIATRSEPLKPGETLSCDLGDGRSAATTFEKEEAGRIVLLCTFKDGDSLPFSTRVDAPENQLFFYERPLGDGSRALIGVGAR
jgi:hypothetical protein